MFTIENGILKISVRHLVEFLYTTGSIDNRKIGGSDIAAMQAGTKLHKKLQKSMGPTYKAEVSLKESVLYSGYEVLLEGRADGVFEEDGVTIIDEIKCMYANVSAFEEPILVHLCQAKCYAYIYAKQNNLENIGVWITYVNIDLEDVKRFKEEYSFEEIENWFLLTMKEFGKWSDFLYEWKIKRNKSIKNIEFPFEYRQGQRDLCVSVYRTIERESVLFIQAPTGVGKTMSNVFPAVKAMGEEKTDKIFYLTAKTITRKVALEAFDILREKGLTIKDIVITAKEKTCPYGMQCNPTGCPAANGHFDRVNNAVFDIINNEDSIDMATMLRYAEKHNVCPHEFTLDVTYWCDAIIGDYNYVFDPNAYLRRYFAEGEKKKYTLLIDEAHNLVERGRNMYSATLEKSMFLSLEKIMKIHNKKIANYAKRVNKALLEIKREITGEFLYLNSIDSILLMLFGMFEEMQKFMEYVKHFEYQEEFIDYFFRIRDFLIKNELLNEGYVDYAYIKSDGDVVIKKFCIDPSENINACIGKCSSAIFFSATLLPILYYKNLLRGKEDDFAVYAHSVFDPKKRRVLIAKDLNTKYTLRNISQYTKVYEYIKKITGTKTGNYMVFFPSYGYLQEVLSLYNEKDFDICVQELMMDETMKEEFLQKFDVVPTQKSFVGFCVMGGIFSEGIDLKAEKLIGAICVGCGLPQVGIERSILSEWFDKQDKGYEYAFMYPGLNKVLQAAGRVIRTEDDRGVIALLDNRFLSGSYDGLLPKEWEDIKVTTLDGCEGLLLDFWGENVLE